MRLREEASEKMSMTGRQTALSSSMEDETIRRGTRRKSESYLRPGVSLAAIFLASVIFIGLVLLTFPELDENDMTQLKFPRNIDAAKDLGRLLSKYKTTNYYSVLGAMLAVYIFLQTFAIPGSIFLSILSGFLFPFPLALLLVCTCSAVGATCCYLLSAMVIHRIVNKYFPQRIHDWKEQVRRHHGDMMWYIIFLRITPFLPNWFINLASPVVGVGIAPFFWGTFLGVAPPSFFFIRAGTTLYQLTTTTGHISLSSFLFLALLALLSLAPVLYKKLVRTNS